MVRCYDCGQPIPDESIVRRTVCTGRCFGSRSSRAYYHKVSLCPSCSAARDKGGTVGLLAAAAVTGLAVLGSFALCGGLLSRATLPPPTANPLPLGFHGPQEQVGDAQQKADEDQKRERLRARQRAREEAAKKEEERKAEERASSYLEYAKKLVARNELDKARERLREVVDKFPKTQAAREAREVLETLAK